MRDVFSDSDGVVFDMETGFFNAFGVRWEEIPIGRAWNLIYRNPDFYETLPLMPGALEYWEAVSKYGAKVLTGAPTAGHQAAADAKRRAWSRHFGSDVEVTVCFSRDKPKHMGKPGTILIDDTPKVIANWEAHQGTGILFLNKDQAIHDLKVLMDAED